MTTRNERLTLALSNALYSFMALGLVMSGLTYSLFRGIGKEIGYYLYAAISELLLIAVPALICIRFVPLMRRRMRRGRIRFSQILLIFVAALAGIFFISSFTLLWDLFLTKSGGTPMEQAIPIPTNTSQLLLGILSVAVSPAISEELLVRGAMLPSYEKFGKWFALLLSGLLFAILHGNIAAFPGHFLLGIVIGYLVLETNSLFAGMLYHFAHNGFSLLFSYINTSTVPGVESSAFDYRELIGDELFAFIASILVFSVVLGLIFLVLIRWIRRISKKRQSAANLPENIPSAVPEIHVAYTNDIFEKPKQGYGILPWLTLIPGLLVAAYLYWLDYVTLFGLL